MAGRALFCLVSTCLLAQTSAGGLQEQYYEHGERALAQGQYAQAEQAYEKLRQLDPGIAEVHARLGLIYFQERKFELAVQSLRQALKLKPSLPRLDTLLAMSLSELGRYSEALPGLEKGFHHSTDPAIKRMCGLQLERAYTGLRQDGKATGVALELSQLYPDDPEVLYHAGQIFGNYAFLSMQKLAQVAPNSVWRHQAAGEAYESQGSNDLAVREFQAVLAIDPRRPGVHYRLGRTLLARFHQRGSGEDKSAALQEFKEELNLEPGNANAAYEIAEIDRKAGDLDEAQQFFEQALKYYPDFEEAHIGLAAVLLSRQKPQEALSQLQKAIALNPNNEVSWYRLAQAYRMLNNAAEREKAFSEFQRLKSGKSAAQEAAKQMFSPTEVTQQQVDAEPK